MKLVTSICVAAMFAVSPAVGKGIRDRKPAIEQDSSRSMAEIQQCLAEKWVQMIDFPVGAVPMTNGIIYNTRSPVTEFSMIVEVKDVGDRRDIVAYVKAAPVSFVRISDHLNKIRSCL